MKTVDQTYAIAVVGILAVVLVGWTLFSYFEARAYENATGKSISTWDAMFLELRVQESAK